MKRFRAIACKLLFVISATLCLVASVLAIRSYWVSSDLRALCFELHGRNVLRTDLSLSSQAGELCFDRREPHDDGYGDPERLRTIHLNFFERPLTGRAPYDYAETWLQRRGFFFYANSGDGYVLYLPYTAFILLPAVFAGAFGVRLFLTGQRKGGSRRAWKDFARIVPEKWRLGTIARRFWNCAVVLGALVGVAVLACSISAWRTAYTVECVAYFDGGRDRGFRISLCGGEARCTVYSVPSAPRDKNDDSFRRWAIYTALENPALWTPGCNMRWQPLQGFGWDPGPRGRVDFWLPIWPVVVLAMGSPAGWAIFRFRRAVRQRRRLAAGACAGCGYDLRATPDRCPECGLPARAV